MTPPLVMWSSALIGVGLVVALIRLVLWRRAASAAEAEPSWRFPVLIALNILTAMLLYLTLHPPDVGVGSGRLVVLTAGAPADVATEPGDRVVALPEGPAEVASRVPDLATALRRYPEARLIAVVGEGLAPRDRAAVDRPVAFDEPSAPPGFGRIDLPDAIAAGAPFTVGGTVGLLNAGAVELTDPSGTVVDQVAATPNGSFVLAGSARAAGLAVFELRLRDAQGRLVERIDVPIQAREPAQPRVIVMAGAPGPEPRFLRRWAEAAQIDLSIQLALGAGVDLTAQAVPLTDRTLSRTDLLVIDERSWDVLGTGERAAVRAATAAGMGLLLRPTGPLSASTRRDWAALGAPLSGGETLRPVALDEPPSADVERLSSDLPATNVPELTRRDFAHGGNAVELISDADGAPLATWRPFGDGRVGVWTVTDSYALVLTGQAARHGELWSRMVSALARAEGAPPPRLDGIARAGHRAGLCGITNGDVLIAPDGERTRLMIDPRAGPTACAAIWPLRSGWHAVVDGQGERGIVYVHTSNATPSLIATESGQATRDLQFGTRHSGRNAPLSRPGSPLPWLLGLLMITAALWWLERRRPTTPTVDQA